MIRPENRPIYFGCIYIYTCTCMLWYALYTLELSAASGWTLAIGLLPTTEKLSSGSSALSLSLFYPFVHPSIRPSVNQSVLPAICPGKQAGPSRQFLSISSWLLFFVTFLSSSSSSFVPYFSVTSMAVVGDPIAKWWSFVHPVSVFFSVSAYLGCGREAFYLSI